MSGWSELGKLPRSIWLLNVANTINRMGSMAFLFLGLFVTKQLGYPAKVAGALLGTYGLTALLTTPLGGWLCDVLGPRRVLIASLVVNGLLLSLFPWIHGLPGLFVLTVFVAISGEVFGPAMLTYSTAALSNDLKKPSIALGRLSHNLGMSVGPAVGGFLAAIAFHWVFWVDSATTLVAAAMLIVGLADQRVDPASSRVSFFTSTRQSLADRRLVYFLLAGIPLGVAWFQFGTILPIYLVKTLGMKESQYGFLFTLNTLMIVFLEIPLTMRTNHWQTARTLYVSALTFAAGFVFLVIDTTYGAALAMMAVSTFGEMLISPSSAAYVSQISPRGREGAYMGCFAASYCCCAFLAPLFGGWLLDACGGRTLWAVNMALAALSAGLFARVKAAPGNAAPEGAIAI